MKNCLFVQWKKPTDASRFVIDGKVSKYSGTEMQNKVMKLFANVPKYKEICSSKGRNDLSPSFRCSYHKSKYFIEGNFEETDFSERKLVYIFATLESDSSKRVQILQEYAHLLGVTIHAEDIEEIKKCKYTNKKSKRLLWTIVVIAILLLSFMLLRLQSKQ